MGFSHFCPETQSLRLHYIAVSDCCLPRSVDVIGGEGCAENLGVLCKMVSNLAPLRGFLQVSSWTLRVQKVQPHW